MKYASESFNQDGYRYGYRIRNARKIEAAIEALEAAIEAIKDDELHLELLAITEELVNEIQFIEWKPKDKNVIKDDESIPF